MKVVRKSYTKYTLTPGGVYDTKHRYSYAAVDRGVINIPEFLELTPKEMQVVQRVFYTAMDFLDKNYSVDLGVFGTLKPSVECKSRMQGEQYLLNLGDIKKVSLKLKPSAELLAILSKMKDNITLG